MNHLEVALEFHLSVENDEENIEAILLNAVLILVLKRGKAKAIRLDGLAEASVGSGHIVLVAFGSRVINGENATIWEKVFGM